MPLHDHAPNNHTQGGGAPIVADARLPVHCRPRRCDDDVELALRAAHLLGLLGAQEGGGAAGRRHVQVEGCGSVLGAGQHPPERLGLTAAGSTHQRQPSRSTAVLKEVGTQQSHSMHHSMPVLPAPWFPTTANQPASTQQAPTAALPVSSCGVRMPVVHPTSGPSLAGAVP